MPAKKAKASAKITGETTLGDVVAKFPQAVPAMLRYGLHCAGCHVAAFETVGQGAAAHGLAEAEIKKMLKEMNDSIK
jgi:hybrid cluster-associated redox disulfide protein